MADSEPTVQSIMTDVMAESSYTPFKLEMVRYVNQKDQYETLLKVADWSSPNFRDLLINTGRVLFSEGQVIMTEFERKHFIETLNEAVNLNRNIEVLQKGAIVNYYNPRTDNSIKGLVEEYQAKLKTNCYRFLLEINDVMQKHGGGMKINSKAEQIDTVKSIFQVKNVFDNPCGIPISIEMEFFARNCVQRVRNKFDNFFIVEADTGKGKTSFVWGAGSTISAMQGNGFTVNGNFIFNEDKAYVDKVLRNAPFGFVLDFDEIGNQANSKTHWDPEQIILMNDTRLIRFMGLSVFGCWTSKDELDKQLRTRINGMITIEERGKAQFRTYNKNRFTPNKEFIPYAVKNKVAYTSADANNIIEMYDELNHMTIPFYEIPPKYWEEYEEQKKLAKTMRRQSGRFFENVQTATESYTGFLSEVPADCMIITSAQLKEYSNKIAFELSFRKLMEKVAKATGKKVKEIFVWSQNPADMWEGYINVDPVITSYIVRIKAMKKGSDESAKRMPGGS